MRDKKIKLSRSRKIARSTHIGNSSGRLFPVFIRQNISIVSYRMIVIIILIFYFTSC